MHSYTLTAKEAAMYDSTDERQQRELMSSLASRFGRPAGGRPIDTEIYHPDGYVIEAYAAEDDE